VLSGLQITASDCPFWLLETFIVLFLFVIVLSGLRITASDYPKRNLKARQHNNQKKKDKKSLKMPKGLSEAVILFVIVLSDLQITACDYPFGVFNLFLSFFFRLLCCLAFKLRLLITRLASSIFSCTFSFGYCVVWPSNYGF
jgi:hypothetical protein